VKVTSTQPGLASTSKPCHGTKTRARKTDCLPSFPRLFRKPTLYSRISLGTSNEPDPHYSTVSDHYHSSLNQSGSSYLAEMPSTSTMCSQTSTQYPVMSRSQSRSENRLKCYMGPRSQPNQSRPMEIGSLPGTPWLMPHCSSLSTRDLNSSCTGNISRGISLPYLPNSTPESSIMTELCESEHHNDVTLSYPVLRFLFLLLSSEFGRRCWVRSRARRWLQLVGCAALLLDASNFGGPDGVGESGIKPRRSLRKTRAS